MLTLALVAATTLLGCGGGEVIDPPDAIAGDFSLRLESTDRTDRLFEVEVRGAPQGAELLLVATDGSGEGSPCPEGIAPVCLTIRGDTRFEGASMADEDGEAWWYVPFSAAGSDGHLEVQVFTVSEPLWVSNGLRLRAP